MNANLPFSFDFNHSDLRDSHQPHLTFNENQITDAQEGTAYLGQNRPQPSQEDSHERYSAEE